MKPFLFLPSGSGFAIACLGLADKTQQEVLKPSGFLTRYGRSERVRKKEVYGSIKVLRRTDWSPGHQWAFLASHYWLASTARMVNCPEKRCNAGLCWVKDG